MGRVEERKHKGRIEERKHKGHVLVELCGPDTYTQRGGSLYAQAWKSEGLALHGREIYAPTGPEVCVQSNLEACIQSSLEVCVQSSLEVCIQSSIEVCVQSSLKRTRDAVTARLVETLTCPSSVLAKRYGVLPEAEAASVAGEIEKEAYDAAESASDEAKAASVEGGIEILEIYSKAISRKMLESVKARGGVQNMSPPEIENLSVEDAEKESRGGGGAGGGGGGSGGYLRLGEGFWFFRSGA
ncbi:uncharacterized protein LOC109821105 [Asparagus officinalis]|uniref:uncharacterized protein LOC109821105 n=1 Tax=Asparagus officinalis TaxID=4686 RepID=UPI00098E48DF|nr:uncharacterized protein LOC109821105 [Asparagus officinalis]